MTLLGPYTALPPEALGLRYELFLVGIMALLVLLVMKLAVAGIEKQPAAHLDRVLPIPMVPLLVAFVLIAILRVADAL